MNDGGMTGATTEGNHEGCPYMGCRSLGTLSSPTRSLDAQEWQERGRVA